MKYQVRQINDEVFHSQTVTRQTLSFMMGRFPNKFDSYSIFRAKVYAYTRGVPHINKLCNKVSNFSLVTMSLSVLGVCLFASWFFCFGLEF